MEFKGSCSTDFHVFNVSTGCAGSSSSNNKCHNPLLYTSAISSYLENLGNLGYSFDVFKGCVYSRTGNPTRNCFETCVAALEGAKHGIATASGVAATMLVTQLLKTGDHILCVEDVYGGTYRYFSQIAAPQIGLEISFVDLSDLSKLESAIKPNTKMVWIETPSNPLLKLVDIQGASEIVHQHEGIILVADNTFMSPYFQRPLSLGADIVMHSVTKYLNGHSDTVMGVICADDDEICNKLRYLQNALGPVPSPFDCFLANRGLKTLHVRMRQHEISALAVARYLEKNPRVERVIYPGLESFPQLELAKKQMTGFGGMVSFFIKGDMENSKQFFKASKVRLCFVLRVNALLYEAEKRLVVTTQIVALSLTRDSLGVWHCH